MGTIYDSTGKLAIDVVYLSNWGGVYNAVNAIACILGGLYVDSWSTMDVADWHSVSDWKGRKFNMICMTGFLMIVSHA